MKELDFKVIKRIWIRISLVKWLILLAVYLMYSFMYWDFYIPVKWIPEVFVKSNIQIRQCVLSTFTCILLFRLFIIIPIYSEIKEKENEKNNRDCISSR